MRPPSRRRFPSPIPAVPDAAHFAFRLVPSRPTFAFDMSDAERAAMGEHVAYWRRHFDTGRVVAFGPVFVAGFATMEVYPMPGAVVRRA